MSEGALRVLDTDEDGRCAVNVRLIAEELSRIAESLDWDVSEDNVIEAVTRLRAVIRDIRDE